MKRLLRQAACGVALILCALAIARAVGVASEVEARRVAASLAIFPRIVAVDTHINDKVDADGVLHLAVVYFSDKNFAVEQAEKLLATVPNIAGRSVTAHAIPLPELAQWYKTPLAGLFITEHLVDKQLDDILAEAKHNHLLVFSPFAGDVERGTMAGLAVGSQIKPYFNLKSLRDAKIEINPVLLRMSKHYE